ncbi:hypothetical protein GCM10010339_19990 [Streptomyces alanosinicus]|uniref:AraC-type transcription regulator ligand-binding domain-containing protein n=1 Tax=Streptomyces alanosinicus TaxID=68171 RepID=A0A918YFK2_9ACTN|nr:hypothetical protein GCM10010339_19990 [Streptomyces alanosinicus]
MRLRVYAAFMDALAGLLDGPRAHGAFMIRACFDPPWAVRVADEAPLTVMLMARGTAWITPDGDHVPCGSAPATWPSRAVRTRTPAATRRTPPRRR